MFFHVVKLCFVVPAACVARPAHDRGPKLT
jgi:hypothetical protein